MRINEVSRLDVSHIRQAIVTDGIEASSPRVVAGASRCAGGDGGPHRHKPTGRKYTRHRNFLSPTRFEI